MCKVIIICTFLSIPYVISHITISKITSQSSFLQKQLPHYKHLSSDHPRLNCLSTLINHTPGIRSKCVISKDPFLRHCTEIIKFLIIRRSLGDRSKWNFYNKFWLLYSWEGIIFGFPPRLFTFTPLIWLSVFTITDVNKLLHLHGKNRDFEPSHLRRPGDLFFFMSVLKAS